MVTQKFIFVLVLVSLLAACNLSPNPANQPGEDKVNLATQLAGPDKFKLIFVKNLAGSNLVEMDVEISLRCAIKSGGRTRYLTLSAFFNGADTVSGYAPKTLWNSVCTLEEVGTLGTYATFKAIQLHKNTSARDNLTWHSSYRHASKLETAGKQIVRTTPFRIRSFPVMRLIVTNQYDPLPTLDVQVSKTFTQNGEDVIPTNIELDLKISCDSGFVRRVELGENYTFQGQLPELIGQRCTVDETFKSGDFQVERVNVAYQDNLGNQGQVPISCSSSGNDSYSRCTSIGNEEPFPIAIDEKATTLTLSLNSEVVLKDLEPPPLLLKVDMSFVPDSFEDETTYPESPEDYSDIVLTLVCEGYSEVLNLTEGVYLNADRNDLYGKVDCFFMAHFKDERYRIEQTVFRYYLGEADARVHIGGSYNDWRYDGYDSVNSHDDGRGLFTFDRTFDAVEVSVTNRMKLKFLAP